MPVAAAPGQSYRSRPTCKSGRPTSNAALQIPMSPNRQPVAPLLPLLSMRMEALWPLPLHTTKTRGVRSSAASYQGHVHQEPRHRRAAWALPGDTYDSGKTRAAAVIALVWHGAAAWWWFRVRRRASAYHLL
jgi:hypothetical protein